MGELERPRLRAPAEVLLAALVEDVPAAAVVGALDHPRARVPAVGGAGGERVEGHRPAAGEAVLQPRRLAGERRDRARVVVEQCRRVTAARRRGAVVAARRVAQRLSRLVALRHGRRQRIRPGRPARGRRAHVELERRAAGEVLVADVGTS